MFRYKRMHVKMNKNHKKKKSLQILPTSRHLIVAVLLGGLLLVGGSHLSRVFADQFDEQIRQLNAQNAVKQDSANQLGAQASSYQDQVNKLQLQISSLQAQITANQNRINSLQVQITQAEAELAKQKKLLGDDIRAMYVEDKITTLEMLASSKDLSDFVDKQQYRNSVQNKIKLTLDKVNELKHQLKDQKEALEQSVKDQQIAQNQLAAQQGEQHRLLSLTVDQQNQINGEIQQNNSKISELRRQQAIANASLFTGGSVPKGIPGGGGYPGAWAFAPQDSIIDSWGMYNRECVSFTAWKVWSTGRYMPYWGGRGNANQWDDNARAAGIPTDGSPRAGDVAISNRGFYGHSMYVEAVHGDGTITVSQYNAALDGNYSVARIYVGSLVFIHF